MLKKKLIEKPKLKTVIFLLLIAITFPTLLLSLHLQQELRQKAAGIPQFSHVFVIMYENHSYSQIIGNSAAPYINQIANQYGLATNFLAIAHPSLPNYLAFSGGSTFGVTSDCNTCFQNTTANIFSELEAAGKTWKSYHESMPSNCFLNDSGSYVLHHNPAAYYFPLRSSCSKNDVPYSQFASDLASGNIGSFNFIVPNNNDNMHTGSIQAGDNWLKSELPKILASQAFLNNGVVFFTFDEESDKLSPNQIVTVVISPLAKQQFKSNISYTLYSLLRTVADVLGVIPPGQAASATPMGDFFGSSAGVSPTPTISNPPQSSPNLSPTISIKPSTSPVPNNNPSGLLHVQKNQIIDSMGNTVILRGGQIAGPLNFISGWQQHTDPAQYLNPAVFNAMASWGMNVLRLPVTTWYYTDPIFMPKLDSIVKQANQSGLYVVIAGFDNAKSGSPYGTGADVTKAEQVTFWKFMAGHFANNPMVLFDLLNEPSNLSAQNYLNGGGSVTGSTGKTANIIGFQPLIDAVRSTGAKQIIILPADIVNTNPSARTSDPNVMYTVHIYAKIGTDTQMTWDADWGSLLNNYPLYYGEWAVIPNSLVPAQCQPYTPANADAKTNAFLNYMEQRNASWTAWEFRTYYLIQDSTNFTPTTFAGSWTTCDQNGHEGMGLDIKNYLKNISPITITPGSSETPIPTTDTSTPPPTDSTTPPTPLPIGSITPSPTLGPTTGSIAIHFEGIDTSNNFSPHHLQRQIILSFYKTNDFSTSADFSVQIAVTFSSGGENGSFINDSIDLSSILPGSYYILVKSQEGSLREILNNSQPVNIVAGQNNQLNGTANSNQLSTLRMGDLNDDNVVDLKDYNILVDCYADKSFSSSCIQHKAEDQTKGIFADLNDDGIVNGIDYNMLIRNFNSQGY